MGSEQPGTSLKVEARGKYNAKLPPRVPGEHLWIIVGMWRVNPTPAPRLDLDLENLLTLEGPGCYWCEQPWTETLAAAPCGR